MKRNEEIYNGIKLGTYNLQACSFKDDLLTSSNPLKELKKNYI
jgi:hypothetical protein